MTYASPGRIRTGTGDDRATDAACMVPESGLGYRCNDAFIHLLCLSTMSGIDSHSYQPKTANWSDSVGQKVETTIKGFRSLYPEWRFLDRNIQADKLISEAYSYGSRSGVVYDRRFFIFNWSKLGTSVELDGDGRPSDVKSALATAAKAGRDVRWAVSFWREHHSCSHPFNLSSHDFSPPSTIEPRCMNSCCRGLNASLFHGNLSVADCARASCPPNFVGVGSRGSSSISSNINSSTDPRALLLMSSHVPHSYEASGE